MHTSVPDTSTTLLQDISRDFESPRWEEFVRRYRPAIQYYLSILRSAHPALPLDLTQDVEQESLLALFVALPQGKFDRSRGRFRDFLFGIVRNQLRKAFEKSGKALDEDPLVLDAVPDASTESDSAAEPDRLELEREVTRLLLDQVFREGRFSGQSKAIFLKLVVEEVPVADLSRSYGLPANAIYQLKKRVLDRLRDLRESLTPPGGDLVDLLEVLLGQP